MVCKEPGFIHNDLFTCLHLVLNFSFQNHSAGQGEAQTKPENTFFWEKFKDISGYSSFRWTKEIREKILLSSWLHDRFLLENNGMDLRQSDQVEGSPPEHSNPMFCCRMGVSCWAECWMTAQEPSQPLRLYIPIAHCSPAVGHFLCITYIASKSLL